MRRSSSARFVGMCRLLHIAMCSATLRYLYVLCRDRPNILKPKIKPGTVSRPRSGTVQHLRGEDLIVELVEFHAISRHDVFIRKHDHTGRRRVGHAEDHDLTYRTTRQVADVNHRTVLFLEHLWIERGHFLLRILSDRGPER